MKTKSISVTELKQNLGEMINQAAYGGQRIILLSYGKERAALVSMEDLRLLESFKESEQAAYQQQQARLLADVRELRESATQGYSADSATVLDEVREERLDDLADLR